ncbi:MAG: DUF3667 domain-containing protein, partial [Gammaproteobacteria bacterium]
HVCGQSTVNPVRHVGHALEEVLESFWHLDGRIWRTLRDLISPGRVAVNYLAGHRARYVAPLRLFLVLTVVTFFVAKFTVHFGTVHVEEAGTLSTAKAAFERAKSVASLQRVRDERIGNIYIFPGAERDALIGKINASAQKRAEELQPGAQLRPPPASAVTPGAVEQNEGDMPTMAPDFAKDWANRQTAHVRENLMRVQKDPELLSHAFLSAVPTVLFVLMPIFAFLLQVAYMRQKRLYLEHLVVALYSHAWLLLVLLAMCLLTALGAQNSWLETPTGWLNAALWLWVPIYLWLMQKRVYRQNGFITTLKFLQMGVVYGLLVGCGLLLAFAIGVIKM